VGQPPEGNRISEVLLKPNEDGNEKGVRAGGPSKLELIASAVLILWLVHNFFVFFPSYGLAGFVGGTIADVRVWVLVVGLLVLRYRSKRATPKEK
jgi:hypothetical protein